MLHNRINRKELIEKLNAEPFTRKTVSFYRYIYIDDPAAYRDTLYLRWDGLNIFGRIYMAHEGINAQMSVPEHAIDAFVHDLHTDKQLKGVPLKWAVEDDGKSFYKLTLKVRAKIVADGLDDHTYDVTNVGTHLDPLKFHELAGQEGVQVVDMRNHYESEVGHFEGAFCPDADTFREAINMVTEKYKGQEDKPLLLYCTGGIRCEKASAYLRHKGFRNVNQLYGGIIAYADEIKKQNLPSRFTGKNFVFDQRLGESINGKVIAHCHQCGQPCDTHTNCANDDCHLLFIQCSTCRETYEGCCSDDCKEINRLPEEEKKALRKARHEKYAQSKIFRSRLRPYLIKQHNEKHYHVKST